MIDTKEVQTLAETLAGMVTYTSMTIRTETSTIAVTLDHLGNARVAVMQTQRNPKAKLSDTRKRKVRKLFPMCVYCTKKQSNTVDHVIPRARGGSNNESNLVGCCTKCNEFKGDRTPKEAGMKIHYPSHLVKTLQV